MFSASAPDDDLIGRTLSGMRCLHCGKRLSLLRKFSDAEFCSDEHRQEFQQQQSDLALARLIEAQNRMGRPRPPKTIPSTKPGRKAKVVENEPGIPMARIVYEIFRPVGAVAVHLPPLEHQPPAAVSGLPWIERSLTPKGFPAPGQLPLVAPLPSALPPAGGTPSRALFRLSVALPSHAALAAAPELPAASGLLALQAALAGPSAGWMTPAAVSATAAASRPALPAARFSPDRFEASPAPPEKQPAFGAAVPLPLAPSASTPAAPLAPPCRLEASFVSATPAMPWLAQPAARFSQGRKEASPAPPEKCLAFGSAVPLPLAPSTSRPAAPLAPPCRLEAGFVPAARVLPPPAVKLQSPGLAALEEMRALPAGLQRTPPVSSAPPDPAPQLLPALPPPAPLQAGLRPAQRSARIKVKAMAAAAGVCAPPACPELSVLQAAFPALGLVSALPGLRREGQQALPLDIQASAAAGCAALPWLSGLLDAAREAAYPRSAFRTLPPEPPDPTPQPQADPEPDEQVPPQPRGLPVQLPRPADCGRGEPRWAGPVMALAATPDPRMPACRLPIDQADGSGPRRTRPAETARKSGLRFAFDARRLPGRRFWTHAPADLKWVALGLPLLLVLVLYSFRPGTPPPDAAGDQLATTGRTAIGEQVNALQRVILSRAAVRLFDDFRGGLGSWSGEDGWSKTWKYGAASFLEPGQLALYAPTVGMRDYTFQFLGQIERKSLNWVFRASDAKNYYAMRIVITRGGPLPEAQLVRSTVIGGKERDVTTMPIPFPVRPDTLYLVKMDIRGDDYTTYIQGQVVDTFTDSRLEQGGVGFYSARGEQSMLRWVELTHQYDFLGRLCALVAPYDLTAQGRQAN